MTSKIKDQIKSFFETGDKPSQAQFIDLIDSYVDKSGPIGTIETACSAGSTGVMIATGGAGSIAPYATVLASQGVTVYTTALSTSVTLGLAATTAQAVAGTDNSTIMTPVLVKNAVSSLGSSPLVLLGTGTASASTSLSFTSLISSTYTKYLFVFEALIHSATASIGMNMSNNNGSSYAVGMSSQKSSIAIGGTNAPTLTGVSNSNPVLLTDSAATGTVYNGFGSLVIGSSGNAIFEFLNRGDLSTDLPWTVGMSTAAGVNAIQFLPSSGNFTSGKIYMYGVKNT